MNKKTLLNKWCDKAWMKFGCLITAVITILITINWNTWSTELKVIAGIAGLIPIHVLEEWIFPGGFHYQYNTVMKSDYLNCYPMNRLADMITNLVATFLYIILTIICIINGNVSMGIRIGTIIFCMLEFIIHSLFGFIMWKKFKSNGKTTIYGPGSVTAYLGFGFFGALLFGTMHGYNITSQDWFVAILILAFILIICILLPQNLLKKKDSEYYFSSAGYFEKYIK